MSETKDMLVKNMQTILNIKWRMSKSSANNDTLRNFAQENKDLIGEYNIETEIVGSGWGTKSIVRIKE